MEKLLLARASCCLFLYFGYTGKTNVKDGNADGVVNEKFVCAKIFSSKDQKETTIDNKHIATEEP